MYERTGEDEGLGQMEMASGTVEVQIVESRE